MHKVPTKNDYSRTAYTWPEYAFVFVGLAIAGGASALGASFGLGAGILAPVWLGALAWTALASIAQGLWRSVRFSERGASRERERRRGDELSYRWRTDPSYSCLPGNAFHSSRL